MTESEWSRCTDPQAMLDFLRASGQVSDRKLRLFAVACCRRIWHLLPDERSRRAIEVGERYADGQVTGNQAITAGDAAAEVSGHNLDGIPAEVGWRAARAADHLLPLPEEAWQLNLVWAKVATAMEGEQLVLEGAHPELLDSWSEQSVESGRTMGWTADNPEGTLARILREVYGPLPFRNVRIDPAWLAWHDSTVRKLAQASYDERILPEGILDQSRLVVLADALEEAGCTNQDLLSHCRNGGTHVRGCWVLDLLLGKQ
jgi:hypothetical protein